MSAKPHGLGAGRCDVCGRVYTWGCGHSGSQESAYRKHYATKKHARRECECYGHDHCDPKSQSPATGPNLCRFLVGSNK